MEAITNYFTGEKEVAFWLFPIGLGMLLFALFQVFRVANVSIAFWTTIGITGLLQIGLSLILWFNSPKQLGTAQATYQAAPTLFKKEEGERIIKTLKTFKVIKWTWLVLIGLGIIFYFLPSSSMIKQIILALGIQAFIMLFFDIAAEKRIRIYHKSIRLVTL